MIEKRTGTPESDILKEEAEARRDFLKKAVAVGVTAPAVALLLSAKPRLALAQSAAGTTIINGPA